MKNKKQIILASNNENKLKEVEKILDEYEVFSLQEIGFNKEIEESGTTLEENAKIKAQAVKDYALSKGLNLPVLADDTGLCVNALDGAPGVRSARYSGINASDGSNIKKLLKELVNIQDRSANFTCVMALIDTNNNWLISEGRAEGSILTRKKGKSGFGYDSIFYSTELNKSFGEASESEKNKVSHRAKALMYLKEKILEEK